MEQGFSIQACAYTVHMIKVIGDEDGRTATSEGQMVGGSGQYGIQDFKAKNKATENYPATCVEK